MAKEVLYLQILTVKFPSKLKILRAQKTALCQWVLQILGRSTTQQTTLLLTRYSPLIKESPIFI